MRRAIFHPWLLPCLRRLLPTQFNILCGGPFSIPGHYRVRVILHDGYQPVEAGPDLLVGASTSRKSVEPRGGSMVRVVCGSFEDVLGELMRSLLENNAKE